MAKKKKLENVRHIYRIKLHNAHKHQKALFLFRYAAPLRKGIISILSFSEPLSRSHNSLVAIMQPFAFAVHGSLVLPLDVTALCFGLSDSICKLFKRCSTLVHCFCECFKSVHIQTSFGGSGRGIQCVILNALA